MPREQADNSEAQFYKEMGIRIQRARRKLGITQEALGSMVALTRTSIVNIEKGRQKVLAHTFAALSRALGVGPQELLPELSGQLPIEELLRDSPKPTQDFVRSAIASTLHQKKG